MSVIDGATNTVTHTITVGETPNRLSGGLAVRHGLVTYNPDGTVSVTDGATHTVTRTVTAGTDPWGVAATPPPASPT